MGARKSKNTIPQTLKKGAYAVNDGDLVTVDSSRAAGSVGITAGIDTVCGVSMQTLGTTDTRILIETGDFLLDFDAVADTDTGKACYASSATACTIVPSGMYVGTIGYVESATKAWVRIQGVDAFAAEQADIILWTQLFGR